MSLEIASNECMSVQVDRLDTLESPKPWHLFGKHAMKLRIDTVSVDGDRNENAYRLLDWTRSYFNQGVAHRLQYLVRMALTDGSNQSFPTREISRGRLAPVYRTVTFVDAGSECGCPPQHCGTAAPRRRT
jgi:hypothetical protein